MELLSREESPVHRLRRLPLRAQYFLTRSCENPVSKSVKGIGVRECI